MKNWYNEMKKNPTFSSLKSLNQVKREFLYLEIMETILNEGFRKSLFKVVQYPLCFYKLKLIIALLLPKFAIKKIQKL